MIIIVLPAYNEESSIGRLLEAMQHVIQENQMNFHLIIVDDGSSDNTAFVVKQYAQKMPIELVTHPVNLGLGEAIKTGLLRGIEVAGERDIIITMDSDNTHNPDLMIRLFRMIREGYDVVIASRYQRESRIIGVPMHRRALSLGASILLRMTYPIKGIKDYTCGYRAYRAEVLKEAWMQFGGQLIERSGFSCMVELLLKLRTMSLIMGEVPLILRYDQKQSATKMVIRRNIRDILNIVFKGNKILEKKAPNSDPTTIQQYYRKEGKW